MDLKKVDLFENICLNQNEIDAFRAVVGMLNSGHTCPRRNFNP